jgi:hypothetical protein
VGKGAHQSCKSITLFAAFAGEKCVFHEFGELPVPQASAETLQAMVNFGEGLGGFHYVSGVKFVCTVNQRSEIALEGGEWYQQRKKLLSDELIGRDERGLSFFEGIPHDGE